LYKVVVGWALDEALLSHIRGNKAMNETQLKHGERSDCPPQA
jgi:hypothetical protein